MNTDVCMWIPDQWIAGVYHWKAGCNQAIGAPEVYLRRWTRCPWCDRVLAMTTQIRPPHRSVSGGEAGRLA